MKRPMAHAYRMNSHSSSHKPGRTALIAIYVVFAAEVARTLTSPKVGNLAAWYLALFLPFVVLLTIVLFRPDIRPWLMHAYFAAQSALTLALLSLNPQLDLITALFALLSYQVALVFVGTTRWVWVGILALLCPGSLLFYLGLRGLALGLVPMAVGLVLAAYVAVVEETERARAESQALLSELEEAYRQLQAHAGQVEELAAVEERIRLARDLHDSVSQTIFSITLNTRSTQILLQREPGRVRAQLEQLQVQTQAALAEMRGLIAKLRPKSS
jgi:signal transduction histidine kinase